MNGRHNDSHSQSTDRTKKQLGPARTVFAHLWSQRKFSIDELRVVST